MQVFASCSADQTIRIWDARKKQSSALTIQAHDAHVNVINWNKSVNYLMVSGGDEGLFKVWDMRTFSRYGREAIWSPYALFSMVTG